MADQFDADAGFPRRAGSGRYDDTFRMHRLDLFDGHFVVAANLNPSAQFAQVLDEVVSKRIVVIEDEDHVSIVAVARSRVLSLTGWPLIAMLTGDFDRPLKL
jgi:hypothetical protein